MITLVDGDHKIVYFNWAWTQKCLLGLDVNTTRMFTLDGCKNKKCLLWLSVIIRMFTVVEGDHKMFTLVEGDHKNVYSVLGWSHKCLLWLMVITRLFTLDGCKHKKCFFLVERNHKNVYSGWGWSKECLLWLRVITRMLLWLDVNTRMFSLVGREHKNVYFGWT